MPNEEGTYATVQLKSGVTILATNSKGQVFNKTVLAMLQVKKALIVGGIDEGEEPLWQLNGKREKISIEAEMSGFNGLAHLETSTIKGPVYLFRSPSLTFH